MGVGVGGKPSVRNMVKLFFGGGGSLFETFIWAQHRPSARPISSYCFCDVVPLGQF